MSLEAARLGPGDSIAPEFGAVCTEFRESGAIDRLFARDFTLWDSEPNEITNRLGWLDEPAAIDRRSITAWAEEIRVRGISTVLWCGMGGSSLFPELLASVFADAAGARLVVLDTSHPHAIERTLAALDPTTTLFAFASKSGGTIETRSHLELCWDRYGSTAPFACVTDAGSALAEFAHDHDFAGQFHANPNIGGRYSALSHFGLVPAALAGIDLEALISPAIDALAICRTPSIAENPAASLAAVIAGAARVGRDKCTVLVPESVAPFGAWLEQLVAESTGKHGVGILPVVDEPLGPVDEYGNDRLFVTYGGSPANLDALRSAGHPVVDLGPIARSNLAAEVVRWEIATALVGAALRINPFDQPDVESAKVAARAALEGTPPTIETMHLADALKQLRGAPDYIAIQAFVDPKRETVQQLELARGVLRSRTTTAVTLGVGPRYLHSTGQLHKGGAKTAVCLQVVDRITNDLAVPGHPYTFGTLITAQAAGDFDALRAAGQRVARVPLDDLLSLTVED